MHSTINMSVVRGGCSFMASLSQQKSKFFIWRVVLQICLAAVAVKRLHVNPHALKFRKRHRVQSCWRRGPAIVGEAALATGARQSLERWLRLVVEVRGIWQREGHKLSGLLWTTLQIKNFDFAGCLGSRALDWFSQSCALPSGCGGPSVGLLARGFLWKVRCWARPCYGEISKYVGVVF